MSVLQSLAGLGTLIAANFLLFTLDFKHLESVESSANEKMMQARRRCMEEDRLFAVSTGAEPQDKHKFGGGNVGGGEEGFGTEQHVPQSSS